MWCLNAPESKESVTNNGVHEEVEDHQGHETETERHQTSECVNDLFHGYPVPAVKIWPELRAQTLEHCIRMSMYTISIAYNFNV